MGVKTWPLGEEQPFGIKSDHTWAEIGAIFRIIGDYKVQTFVETGVGRGDLASWMMFKSSIDPEFTYLGITNDPNSVHSLVKERINTQAFVSVGAACSPIMIHRVGSLIRNSSVAMVLCNGLDIEREVDHYLKILRPGDIIAAHRFLEEYKGRKIMDMDRNGFLSRIVGDWMNKTRFIAGVIT